MNISAIPISTQRWSWIPLAALLVTPLLQDARQVFTLLAISVIGYIVFHLADKPGFVRLMLVWQVAVLLLIVPDGLFRLDRSLSYGAENVLVAAKYLSMCNLGFLWVYSLGFSERRVKWRLRFAQPPTFIRTRSSTVVAFLLLVAAVLVYCAGEAPRVLEALRQGRGAISVSSVRGAGPIELLLNYLLDGLSGTLPACIAFYFVFVRRVRHAVVYALLVSLPVLITLAILGSRFRLLFGALGLVIVLISKNRLSLKMLIKLACVGALLAISSIVILNFRDFGLSGRSAQITQEPWYDKAFPTEGILSSSAMEVAFFRDNAHTGGLTTLQLVIFWIPRQIWPDKPTFLEYWLMREYYGAEFGRSDIHSNAFGFPGDAYADFGFIGGFLFWMFLGAAMARIEAWNAVTVRQLGNPSVIVSSFLYPTVFFAVRTTSTAGYSLFFCFIIWLVFRRAFGISQTRCIVPTIHRWSQSSAGISYLKGDV